MDGKQKISKKTIDVIKKDFAAKTLLKNPPPFKKENINSITRWIIELSKLILSK
jgi:hypothetical protein